MDKEKLHFSEFLDKLGQVANLDIAAKKIVEGFMVGIHKSPYHGFSAEFSQYKPYNTGDDVRQIDWKLYARSEKYFIKEFEEETNLRASIFLDASESMAFQERGSISKFIYSKYLAAALAYLLQRQKDAIGFAIGKKKITSLLRPSTKASHLREILRILSNLETGPAENLARLIEDFSQYLNRAGMVIIISDFFCEQEQLFEKLKGLKHLGQDVILLQILDPMELEFDYKNDGKFIDMETGESLTISPKLIRKSFQKSMKEFIQKFHSQALEMGFDHYVFTTDEQFDKPLATFLRRRKKWF